jgi:hypothetical protein
VVMEWYGGWVSVGQPLAVITFLSIMQLHDVVVRYRLRMLALGTPFLCAQHPDCLYTGRGVDFTPFARLLPLTIRLVVDARRLALDQGVALAGPVVVYDLCFQETIRSPSLMRRTGGCRRRWGRRPGLWEGMDRIRSWERTSRVLLPEGMGWLTPWERRGRTRLRCSCRLLSRWFSRLLPLVCLIRSLFLLFP